jgi:hypothetical protein
MCPRGGSRRANPCEGPLLPGSTVVGFDVDLEMVGPYTPIRDASLTQA